MNKGLIIINGYSSYKSTLNQVERLTEEFLKLGVDVVVKTTLDVLPIINKDELKINLPKYDFVIFLDKDKYLSHELELLGYKLFNSASSIEICDDKMLTHMALLNSGIRMPKTISMPLCYIDNNDYSYLDNVEQELDYPLVAKECFGSKGSQVYLINNKEELLNIEKSLRFKAHIYQEFITPGGVDYRLIVINNKVIATMKRENKEDFRSNIALGGSGVKVNLPNAYIDMAEKASRVIGLDYCGVDILAGENDEPILCEVNSNAFFEGIEAVTGVNVAKEYALHILKTIK